MNLYAAFQKHMLATTVHAPSQLFVRMKSDKTVTSFYQ